MVFALQYFDVIILFDSVCACFLLKGDRHEKPQNKTKQKWKCQNCNTKRLSIIDKIRTIMDLLYEIISVFKMVLRKLLSGAGPPWCDAYWEKYHLFSLSLASCYGLKCALEFTLELLKCSAALFLEERERRRGRGRRRGRERGSNWCLGFRRSWNQFQLIHHCEQIRFNKRNAHRLQCHLSAFNIKFVESETAKQHKV